MTPKANKILMRMAIVISCTIFVAGLTYAVGLLETKRSAMAAEQNAVTNLMVNKQFCFKGKVVFLVSATNPGVGSGFGYLYDIDNSGRPILCGDTTDAK